MLKSVFLLVLLINLSFLVHGQSFEFWNAYGAKYKVNKQLSISASFTNRIGDGEVSSFFPEVSARFKVFDWLGASVDYRFVSKRAENGNYLGANRYNFNVKLRNSFERIKYSCRLRYQMSSRGGSNQSYESDFDEAFRFKPMLAYNIRKSIFEPSFSLDFFYNPTNGMYGKRFDKVRYSIGTSIELGDAHELDAAIKLDHRFNSNNNGDKLIFALSYTANLKKLLKGSTKKGL